MGLHSRVRGAAASGAWGDSRRCVSGVAVPLTARPLATRSRSAGAAGSGQGTRLLRVVKLG
eukprot:scaffold15554_cov36-Phaeocystis_antarctica.AAC.1